MHVSADRCYEKVEGGTVKVLPFFDDNQGKGPAEE
jgi:hypothetical protein